MTQKAKNNNSETIQNFDDAMLAFQSCKYLPLSQARTRTLNLITQHLKK